jgi:hypothetical protein
MEAIKSLNEPTGSHRTTIANYIEVCKLLLFLSSTRLICSMYAYKLSIPNAVSSVRIISKHYCLLHRFNHVYLLLLLAFIFAFHVKSLALVAAFRLLFFFLWSSLTVREKRSVYFCIFCLCLVWSA